mmetsp:Transcript_8261/g.19431  ORF Transcript_8261/g.19431 Transcript_8261/m.19431 type:complete len:210 (+) Transcript_8261:74-703(+)
MSTAAWQPLAHASRILTPSGYTTLRIPACTSERAHLAHGGHVTKASQSFTDTPILAACIIAFSSAWQMSGYFRLRSSSLSLLSAMPLGRPLKPVERISLSFPTITHPTTVEGSLLHWAIYEDSARNRSFQLPYLGCFAQLTTSNALLRRFSGVLARSPASLAAAFRQPAERTPTRASCNMAIDRRKSASSHPAQRCVSPRCRTTLVTPA